MSNCSYSPFLFFADKMLKISLAERKWRLTKKKPKHPGTSNPQSDADDLNTKGTKRHSEGEAFSEPRTSKFQKQDMAPSPALKGKVIRINEADGASDYSSPIRNNSPP